MMRDLGELTYSPRDDLRVRSFRIAAAQEPNLETQMMGACEGACDKWGGGGRGNWALTSVKKRLGSDKCAQNMGFLC